MRILHTADWHVGKTLARRCRLEETRAALGQVVAIAREEKADAVVVAGDVYEHLAPSAEAEQVVYETLLALEAARIPVVLIPGNHDAPKRWRAIAPLLRRFMVHCVAEVCRPDRGGVVEIPARDGSSVAQIAALPWVSERRIVRAAELMGVAGEPNQRYADELARLIRALCAGLDPRKVTLFAAHLFVTGARLGGGERDATLTLGQTYGITAQALPSVQYVALGHVHRPQRVPGSAVPARYAGSLIQLDFGESGHRKSVALVDLQPGRPAEVRDVPIDAGRQLIDVAGTMDELARHRDSEASAFLRVTLRCDGPQPGLADQIRGLLPHAVSVQIDYPRTETEAPTRLQGIPPRGQFAAYYAARHGVPAPDAMLDLFDELMNEADAS